MIYAVSRDIVSNCAYLISQSIGTVFLGHRSSGVGILGAINKFGIWNHGLVLRKRGCESLGKWTDLLLRSRYDSPIDKSDQESHCGRVLFLQMDRILMCLLKISFEC